MTFVDEIPHGVPLSTLQSSLASSDEVSTSSTLTFDTERPFFGPLIYLGLCFLVVFTGYASALSVIAKIYPRLGLVLLAVML
jgi:hypothetical protein